MPDLLVLCPPQDLNLKLDELGRRHGFRVRATDDIPTAQSWLEVRRFDLAFLHGSVEIKVQERLGGLLWKKNLPARLIVFGLEEEDPRAPESRLFGAEVVRGADVLAVLEGVLRDFRPPGGTDDTQLSIMVVEDLDSPRDIICIFIESLGYSNVVGKECARAALEELHKEPGKYGCIVTDIKMPEMNGAELTRVIRGDPKLCRLPVVVLTCLGTADWLIECLRAGATGFLVKPPKKDDMRRELGRAARIIAHQLDPRLVKEEEAGALRRVLEDRGWV